MSNQDLVARKLILEFGETLLKVSQQIEDKFDSFEEKILELEKRIDNLENKKGSINVNMTAFKKNEV